MCGVRKDCYTDGEKVFLDVYFKTDDTLKALNTAYPNSLRWSKDAQYAQVGKILKRPRINLAVKRHKEAIENALNTSTLLNKRKILDEIIRQYSETAESGASERTNSVQLLKLLAQISKLLDNSTNINNNITVNNAPVVNEIVNYLDL